MKQTLTNFLSQSVDVGVVTRPIICSQHGSQGCRADVGSCEKAYSYEGKYWWT